MATKWPKWPKIAKHGQKWPKIAENGQKMAKNGCSSVRIFQINYRLTVWKFHDFCIPQILREISFGDSGSAKIAFCHFRGCEFGQLSQLQTLKKCKNS